MKIECWHKTFDLSYSLDGINYMKIDNYTIDKTSVWIKAHIN